MHPLSAAICKNLTLTFVIGIALFFRPNLFAQVSPEEALMDDRELKEKLTAIALKYRLDSATLAGYDKIITYEREVYIGKIHNITYTDVRFTCPPGDELNTVVKSRISQILYADGRRDVFIPLEGRMVKQKELVDTNRIIVKTQKDWLKVVVTENPADVENLTALASLKARYEAPVGNTNNDELLRQASIILRKKAALVKAHCVLIETKFFTNSYGDLPKVEVTAKAFGY